MSLCTIDQLFFGPFLFIIFFCFMSCLIQKPNKPKKTAVKITESTPVVIEPQNSAHEAIKELFEAMEDPWETEEEIPAPPSTPVVELVEEVEEIVVVKVEAEITTTTTGVQSSQPEESQQESSPIGGQEVEAFTPPGDPVVASPPPKKRASAGNRRKATPPKTRSKSKPKVA